MNNVMQNGHNEKHASEIDIRIYEKNFEKGNFASGISNGQEMNELQ